MQRPFIPLLLALIAGIALGYGLRLPDPALWIALAATLALLLAASVLKRDALMLPLLMTALLILGILNINSYLYPDIGAGHISAWAGKEKITIDGMICESPQLQPEKTDVKIAAWRVIRDGEAIPVHGNIWLTVKQNPPLAYGDVVRFKTRLHYPHNFNNPGGGDIEKRFLFRETLVRGSVGSPAELIILRKRQGNSLKMSLEDFRNELRTLVNEHAPPPHAQIIQASILGNQKEIPEETMELFNRTGTSHIIAISGFNIGIISAFFIFLIRGMMKRFPYLLLKFNINKVAVIMTVIPIVIFTYVAGAGISVVRATIMVVTFMVALLIGRQRDMVNTLAIAAFLILAVAPYSLFDISFQLSFLAVASILFIAPILSRFLPPLVPPGETGKPSFLKKAFRSTILLLIVTLSATLGTLPLIAFYFNRVSTVVLPANLAVGPILGILAIPVCTAIMIAAPLSTGAAVLIIKTATLLVDISLHITRFFASLSWSSWPVSTPTLAEIGLYTILIYAFFRLLETFRPAAEAPAETGQRRRYFAIVLAVCLVFFAADGVFLYRKDSHPGNLTVSFVDVGQGNSALIRFPGGKKMMVDGGGALNSSFDIGKNVLAPYLYHEKIKKIDIVVLTHPHPDHLQGLIWILNHFDVSEVWSNGEEAGTDMYRQFKAAIREKGIQHRIVSAATPPVTIDDVTIRILNPQISLSGDDAARDGYASANADSLVMRLAYRETSFLLTADISGDEEERILRSGEDIKSQVLLIPHHGSSYSSTPPFLAAVRPEMAVISCGRDNVFGFPPADVLQRIGLLGTKLYRTDTHGAVTVVSDGKKCTASPYIR